MTNGSVLVLSNDTLITALLLSLLELEGFTLLHGDGTEAAAVVVERLKPRLLLLDSHLPEARMEALYHAVATAGTVAVLFSPGHARADVEAMARARGLPWFTLPIGRTRLRELLLDALG
ncbi:MAG TPA: hypothetical protein VFW98_08815 [Gemmatimonadaceae bacterium]|nr:hypothetical protein [Gemmatimonadaceae bacterium]